MKTQLSRIGLLQAALLSQFAELDQQDKINLHDRVYHALGASCAEDGLTELEFAEAILDEIESIIGVDQC